MKYFIETYGCQMNISDSQIVSAILTEAGHQQAGRLDEADLVLFNTCSVRQNAEDRVLGRIRSEMRRKRQKPDLLVGVLGCMAQRMGKRLLESVRGLDLVVGVDQYDKLPALVDKAETVTCHDPDERQLYDMIRPAPDSKYCGFVTIMRGCDNYCSYCIVPYVRGRERSRPVESIRQEVLQATSKGIIDITLLGQNVNSYRYQDHDFAGLLCNLNSINELKRLRFVTSHPKDLSDKLIEAMAECDKVCEQIHLPMQSGDNAILANMNRGYSVEHYIKLVDKLRSAMPDIAITTDVIAGFPGETNEQFEKTVAAMQAVGFDYAFCFKYSNREETAAAKILNQVDERIRLARLQRLIELQREMTAVKFKNQIGKTVEVLVEGPSRQGGNQLSGYTRDFKICVFNGSPDLIGTLVKVKITEATAGTLIGVPV